MEIPKIKYLGEMGLGVPFFNINRQLKIENISEILDRISDKVKKYPYEYPFFQAIKGTGDYEKFLRFIIINTEYSNSQKYQITFPIDLKLQNQDFEQISQDTGLNLKSLGFEQMDYNFSDGYQFESYNFFRLIQKQDKQTREYLLKFVEFVFDYARYPEGAQDEMYFKIDGNEFFIYHSNDEGPIGEVQDLLLKYQE